MGWGGPSAGCNGSAHPSVASKCEMPACMRAGNLPASRDPLSSACSLQRTVARILALAIGADAPAIKLGPYLRAAWNSWSSGSGSSCPRKVHNMLVLFECEGYGARPNAPWLARTEFGETS